MVDPTLRGASGGWSGGLRRERSGFAAWFVIRLEIAVGSSNHVLLFSASLQTAGKGVKVDSKPAAHRRTLYSGMSELERIRHMRCPSLCP